jgi:hypothetical protein
MKRLISILLIGIALPLVAQDTFPIPQPPTKHPLPAYIGSPATPNPVDTSPIPQNPFLAKGTSNCHNDTYMSDLYFTNGPLGESPIVRSRLLATPTNRLAAPLCMAFDQEGRIVTTTSFAREPEVLLIDPVTLATLAAFDFSNVGFGGSYFYLDNEDRVVLPSLDKILVLKAEPESDPPGFNIQTMYDLSASVAAGDAIGYVLPDFNGRLWFATVGGVVGVLQPDTEEVATVSLHGEQIKNGIAIDENGGVFLASDHAMYRFDKDADGPLVITWYELYDRGTRLKAGQLSQGTGTTPTLMGKKYVAITDNADPQMNVNVYRREKTVTGNRLVCTVPVFQPGQSALDSSLIATDQSIVVANAAGYRVSGHPLLDFNKHDGRLLGTMFPGLARIDVDDAGCHIVWANSSIRTVVVPKMSVKNGLIYAYDYQKGRGGDEGFYFTAVDFHTGQTVFQRLVGQGSSFNSYGTVNLHPNGETAYVGVLGGLVEITDTEAEMSH